MNTNESYPNQGYTQQPVYPQQQPGMYSSPGGYPQPVRQYMVGFGEAISRGFSNYATFSGRASRSEFWWWKLFFFILLIIPLILMIFGMVSYAVSESSSYYYDPYPSYHSSIEVYKGLFAGIGLIGLVLYGIICIAMIIPNLAIVWRRLHDTGRSGTWYLLSFVPIVNYVWSIVMLVWFCSPSKPFDNEYGPMPNQQKIP